MSEYLKEEDVVSCKECKCLLKKQDSYQVVVSTYVGRYTNYFCREHKKPYNRSYDDVKSVTYYGEVQMSKDGTPIGYKKIIKKK